jgi:hypothetical protein
MWTPVWIPKRDHTEARANRKQASDETDAI